MAFSMIASLKRSTTAAIAKIPPSLSYSVSSAITIPPTSATWRSIDPRRPAWVAGSTRPGVERPSERYVPLRDSVCDEVAAQVEGSGDPQHRDLEYTRCVRNHFDGDTDARLPRFRVR